jgi:hypothetical protein
MTKTEIGRPGWTFPEYSSLVWREDDATVSCPGHETLEAAFVKIYKMKMPPPLETWDGGDAMYTRLPGGIVMIEVSCPGSEIRVLPPSGL